MRVISRKTLREFWEMYPDCTVQLKAWYQEIKAADWNNHNELKKEFPSASIISTNRVVFNTKGNHYRLIVKISYEIQICWIRFIGTHPDYDKINANEI